MRKRFRSINYTEEHEMLLKQQDILNVQFTHNEEGARNNYSHLNLDYSPANESLCLSGTEVGMMILSER